MITKNKIILIALAFALAIDNCFCQDYDEDEYSSALRTYISQNLSGGQLANYGVILKFNAKKDLRISIHNENQKITKNYILKDVQKKAILMALCRLNSSGSMFFSRASWIKSWFTLYSYPEEKIWHFGSVVWNEDFYGYCTGYGVEIIEDGKRSGELSSKSFPVGAFPEDVFMRMENNSYAKELFDVIRNLAPAEDSNIFDLDDKSISNRDLNFTKYIAGTIQNDSVDMLARKYDFITSFWNVSVKVSVESYRGFAFRDPNNDSKEISINLEGDNLNGFLIGLMRLRMNAEKIYGRYFYSSMKTGASTYLLHFTIPNHGKYKIRITNDLNDVLCIEREGYELADESAEVIPIGIFYSPEFYRIVISLFANIASEGLQEAYLK